ncbi:MAG: 2-amino-4-hydroxy-6-hydroxymethyldihydropteridine diphosphokinase [Saprospiraceae bacterium]|nr:2-amino-4-hydroxy-6-hydroxymethyldihydropteridine diphosphokinase [Saprospiraceae bacterium]
MVKGNITYLLLGSNIGDRGENLRIARNRLALDCGDIILQSGVYLSKSWGIDGQPDYYNQVLQVSTTCSPEQLLDCILDIESTMGRVRKGKWSSRMIDIDILFYQQSVIDLPGLQIPHPRIAERNFTLVPLMEIAPLLEHPTLGITIEELYLQSPDTLEVLMIES